MLAQSALHESSGSSSAAEQLSLHSSGSGSKSPKAKGLAGIFSEILGQAQKNLGAKDSKGAQPSSVPKAEHKEGSDKSELHKAQAARKDSKAAPSLVAAALSPKATAEKAEVPLAKASAHAASGGAVENPKKAGESKRLQERHTGQLERSESEAASDDRLKASEERRKAKAKGQTAEAPYALAALKTLSPNPVSPKPKAGDSASEGDSSINKSGEGRGGSRASSKPELSVLDLRRQAESKKASAAKDAAAKESSESAAVDPAKDGTRGDRASSDHGNSLARELSLDARSPGDSSLAGGARSDSAVASGRGQDLQSLLAERLRDQWNGEIVQSAHIVLRDGDAGTIRLRLRPESLGNVKIELNLSDNNISGKIVVESDEAKSAFERNMNQLADAFKQGGFDTASLQVSVGGGSGGGAQARGGQGDEASSPFFSERLRSAVDSPAEPATAASAYARRGASVDILA